MAVEMSLENLGNLQEVLRIVPRKVANKHVRQATVEGARKVRDFIKRTAPVRDGSSTAYRKGSKRPPPGRLRKLVKAKTRRGKRGYQKASVFYPTEGKGNDPKNAFYWRYLEFGTRHMAPIPFVSVAADTMFRPTVNHIIKRINTGVRAEMSAAKRNKKDF